jgi:HipA-like C-terminal domain
MITPNIDLPETLRALLAQADSLPAAQLQASTGMSQASVSMALSQLGLAVHKLGAARSTRYALTQPILGLAAQQPVRYGADAGNGLFGLLTLLHNGDVHVRGPGRSEWLGHNALPWFLSSLRPQGFLGREYTKLRPDFPPDPDDWTVPQVLYMAANHVIESPGAFDIGVNRSVYVDPSVDARDTTQLAALYDTLASHAGQGLPAGSSAGGEQPKFVTQISSPEVAHVIVKFSPPRGTPFGERWHDLLQLEHLANEVLLANGIDTAHTRIIQSPQRTYLQSQRFDRIGTTGKRHVVAASAVHDEFVKAPRLHWVATCEALVAQKLLPAPELRTVACTYLFGQYIGNSDMHFGNLSFFVDDVMKPQFTVTPVYDMLPMQWRPNIHSGALDADPVRAQPQPVGTTQEAALARQWAVDYWQQASTLPGLSAQLRQVGVVNLQRLQSQFAEV